MFRKQQKMKQGASSNQNKPKTPSMIPKPKSKIDISSHFQNTRTFKRTMSSLDHEDDDFFQPKRPKNKNIFAARQTDTNTNTFQKPLELRNDSDFQTNENNTFFMPKKTHHTKKLDLSKNIDSLVEASKQHKTEEKQTICPYCSEILFPLTDTLKLALDEIKHKDNVHAKTQSDDYDTSVSFSKPKDLFIHRQVSNNDKDAFCRLHKLELVLKPEGLKNGYPREINFDGLKDRMKRFDTELKQIIKNEGKSEFRIIAEDAYKKLGKNKARSTTSIMDRFESTLPGYYGPKGALVIMGVLREIYLESGYLEKELISPQLPLEFLQQVLVPEVGFRLIRQDIFKSAGTIIPNLNEKATKTMQESREYGAALFPLENQNIDQDKDVITELISDDEITSIHSGSDSD